MNTFIEIIFCSKNKKIEIKKSKSLCGQEKLQWKITYINITEYTHETYKYTLWWAAALFKMNMLRYLICLFCYIDETTLGRVNLTFEFTLHWNDILLYTPYTHFN